MRRIPVLCWLSLSVALLFARVSLAQDAAWKSKPIAQWNAEDAKAVLTDSPWVKHATPRYVRDLSPDEARMGGNMDAALHRGVGLAGIDIFNPAKAAEAVRRAHEKPPVDPVVVRWESAPVRAAESKAGETAPAVSDAYYGVVVYNIPLPHRWNLANELKGIAYLKRDKKKDLKPSRVEIIRGDDGLATVVYLFRRSVEITRKDQSVQFGAQLDRLFVWQLFNIEEMRFRGQLEL
jgi:hypothetical protein